MGVHVGRRIAKLRAAFGESLRDAAVRTGVSHTTIARIEKGEVTGSFHSTLRKIAEGYGVRVEFLLTGRDPRRDFDQFLRHLPAEEQGRLYFMSMEARIRLVLNFLATEYPDELAGSPLTDSWGWAGTTPKLEDCSPAQLQQLAGHLSRVTGIAEQWFYSGAGDDPDTPDLPMETLSAYVQVMRKAAQASVHPEMLEMAIDLLIMKHQISRVRMQV